MNLLPDTGCGMVAGWGFFASCVVVQWEHMDLIQCRENCQPIIGGIYRGDIGAFRHLTAKKWLQKPSFPLAHIAF